MLMVIVNELAIVFGMKLFLIMKLYLSFFYQFIISLYFLISSQKARFLPEPRLEEEFPDPTINHKFARNVVWTFEDIQMLLGTDMPIFGGSTHPCISLRLRLVFKF